MLASQSEVKLRGPTFLFDKRCQIMQSRDEQFSGTAALANHRTHKSFRTRRRRAKNPLVAYWRGSYSLAFMLTALVGLRLLLGMVQTVVPSAWLDLWVVSSIAILLWQMVGSMRAADRFVRISGSVSGLCFAYFMMFVAAALTFMQTADALSTKNAPPASNVLNRTLPVLSRDGIMRVDGNLDWELYGAFEQTLDSYPNIQSIRLGSTGGYVFVARAMAEKILERNLDTHIATHCYSACAVAFLAGDRRTMADTAELGFHQYKLEAGRHSALINVADELERDRQFFARRGLSDEFVQQVFTAAHSDLWIPDSDMLRKSGAISN